MNAPRDTRTLCVTAFVCCVLLSACGGGTNGASDQASGPMVPYYPGGLGPYSSLKGVYPDKWTARSVTFMVNVPHDAQRMRIHIDVPGGIYKPGQQGIILQIGSEAPKTQSRLPIGPQVVTVAAPASLRGKRAKVTLTLQVAFVPAKAGLNGDGRELGIRLDDVSFE